MESYQIIRKPNYPLPSARFSINSALHPGSKLFLSRVRVLHLKIQNDALQTAYTRRSESCFLILLRLVIFIPTITRSLSIRSWCRCAIIPGACTRRRCTNSRRRCCLGSPSTRPSSRSRSADSSRSWCRISSWSRGVEGSRSGCTETGAGCGGIEGTRSPAWSRCVTPSVVTACSRGRSRNAIGRGLGAPRVSAAPTVCRSLGSVTEAIICGGLGTGRPSGSATAVSGCTTVGGSTSIRSAAAVVRVDGAVPRIVTPSWSRSPPTRGIAATPCGLTSISYVAVSIISVPLMNENATYF